MPLLDRQTLQMALVAYEIERTKLQNRIAEIQALLDGATSDAAKPARKKRRMSAAARKRIGDATRKRWAARRKAKANKG